MINSTKKQKVYITDTPLIKEWDFDKNIEDPSKITWGSSKKVHWICEKGHEWVAIVNKRRKSFKCKVCLGRKLHNDNCLATVRPEIAKEWHPTKNGILTSKDVTYGCGTEVWWLCEKGHEWESTVNNRTKPVSQGCPGCKGKKAYEDNCLAFLNPDLTKEWHPTLNGILTPYDITCGSDKKVWWICEKGHEWDAYVYVRNSGCGCPGCNGKKTYLDNCLATLRPDIAKQWHSTLNGLLTPYDVTPGSNEKVWWVCEKGHEWPAFIYSRVSGNGCSACSGGTVSKISQEWLDFLGIPIKNREYFLLELNSKVDGFDPETNTVYEFLGDYWHGNPEVYDKNKEHPVCKKTFGQLYQETESRILRLEEAGYKVVYIWEKDFKNNK